MDFFSYTPVGAYNVGSMELSFDKDLITNQPSQTAQSPFIQKDYDKPIESARGDNIGFFHMGSTVVLIFEAPKMLFMAHRGEEVKLGQTLAVKMTPELAAQHVERLRERQRIIDEQFKKEYEELYQIEETSKRVREHSNKQWEIYQEREDKVKQMRKEWYGVDDETIKSYQQKKTQLRERTTSQGEQKTGGDVDT